MLISKSKTCAMPINSLLASVVANFAPSDVRESLTKLGSKWHLPARGQKTKNSTDEYGVQFYLRSGRLGENNDMPDMPDSFVSSFVLNPDGARR